MFQALLKNSRIKYGENFLEFFESPVQLLDMGTLCTWDSWLQGIILILFGSKKSSLCLGENTALTHHNLSEALKLCYCVSGLRFSRSFSLVNPFMVESCRWVVGSCDFGYSLWLTILILDSGLSLK